MSRLTTVEIQSPDLTFSAGHFTIFSNTEREHLHGHNYTVYLAITTLVENNGLMFDYRYYREKIRIICKEINCTFLLPLHSPHLKIERDEQYVYALFSEEKIPFLKRDVTLLPITNSTIEELSHWFLDKLLPEKEVIRQHQIQKMVVKVFSSPGQSGSAAWEYLG